MLYKKFSKQEEIDSQYNPSLSLDNVSEYFHGYVNNSIRIRRQHDPILGIQYGPTLDEYFDFFPAKIDNAPLHVFIHGGYWHSFTSKEFSFVAEAFLKHNVNVAILNYALCPFVTMDEIVRQCRAALVFLYKNQLALSYNSKNISLSGHSAGGHLVAMMHSTNWKKLYGLPSDVIKSSCTISGLFDLGPFPYSWLQPKLQLSADQVIRNSPINHPSFSCGPAIIAVGSEESSEFHSQSETYATSLSQNNHSIEFSSLEGENHFTILDCFLGKGEKLFQMILRNIFSLKCDD